MDRSNCLRYINQRMCFIFVEDMIDEEIVVPGRPITNEGTSSLECATSKYEKVLCISFGQVSLSFCIGYKFVKVISISQFLIVCIGLGEIIRYLDVGSLPND